MCSETKEVLKNWIIVILCLIIVSMSFVMVKVAKDVSEYSENYKECNHKYQMLQLKINYMIERMPEVVKHCEEWQRITANVSHYYASQLIRGSME